MTMTHQTIRTQKIQQRLILSAEYQQAAAAKIAEHLLLLSEIQSAQTIALYVSMNGEVPTHALMQKLQQSGKTLYFPRITAGSRVLDFYQADTMDDFDPNHYGILEPPAIAAKKIAREQLDVVLVPLVAFTEQGDRLGMGGGYYDASFAFRQQARKPILIGLAYAFQKVNRLAPQSWDVRMDMIVTENQITYTSIGGTFIS